MNLRQIEVFRAVVTNGTTARAAEVLRISQPAVSKMIQELERTLGFPVFDRIKGRLRPTAEGQLFFREVEQAFTGLTELRSAAARIRDFGSGKLRIACLSALSTNIAPRALQQFAKRHPNIAVTLQTRTSSVARDLVASGQFDVGIVADEIDTTGIDARPFANFRVAIALPEDHPLTQKDIVRPEDLAGQRFIALSPEDTTRQEGEAAFERANITQHTVIETPFSTTICAMVAQGLGVGLVNPLTAEPYLGRGLVLRPFEPALHFRTLLIMPPNRPPSRILNDFISDLKNVIE
ncbi:LysR substrate-binding domain-containing protein [Nitratireductor kimnyeongensis]|uniref:LysR substrate-binding domain-containing protein n=1 Tax=Nitratireductor kimnyeongensis TaxID=430679 RepID=A0ABW0T5U1_9HYPH|nr:LysR substrate-binding domain-containing protein [Nitratireductor kimnyeongensis]QZZ34365.1 LysR family transcriptional regulator [Nitratireductor kimnyeongensis]